MNLFLATFVLPLVFCSFGFVTTNQTFAASPVTHLVQEEAEAPAVEESAGDTVEAIAVTDNFIVNNLWIMIAGMLVFIMHLGFATLESGLTRSKNTVNILFKNTAIVCLGLISYAVMGFLMMYPASFLEYSGMSEEEQASYMETTEDGYLKKNGYFAFDGFGFVLNGPTQAGVADDATSEDIEAYNSSSTEGYGNPYTLFTDFFFQAMFAATCCTIVSGAVAGRIKLGTFLIFCLFFVSISYPITGSWKWGYGWLDRLGFYDFAGSTLVHSVGGWGALVMAFLLGPRAGKYVNGKAMAIQPSNMPMATIGVFLLWFGWFGFNGGSVLSADPGLVSLTLCTTSMAAAAGGLAAALVSTVHGKKPDLSMTLNGILAGLVGITAGADQMSLLDAIFIGLIAGVLVYVAVIFIDSILKVDDPVGAISVHLVCGIWGTLAVGIFGAKGILGGNAEAGLAQLTHQAIGVAAIGVFTVVFCLVLGLILKVTMGLRVSAEEEQKGLDLGEHGIHAYSL
jgi:Amt family ammonium transporter